MARRKGNTNMAKKASLSQKPEKDDDSGSSSDEHEEESQQDHQNIKKSEQPKLQTSSGSEDDSDSSSDVQTSSGNEDHSGNSNDKNEDESQERQQQNISPIDTINDDIDKENTDAVIGIKTVLYKILKDKYLFFEKYGSLKSSQGVTYFNGVVANSRTIYKFK